MRQVPPDHLLPWRKGPLVYQQLRALERMGICRRVPWDRARRRIVDPKHVYWTFTHDDPIAAVLAELDPGSGSGSGSEHGLPPERKQEKPLQDNNKRSTHDTAAFGRQSSR